MYIYIHTHIYGRNIEFMRLVGASDWYVICVRRVRGKSSCESGGHALYIRWWTC